MFFLQTYQSKSKVRVNHVASKLFQKVKRIRVVSDCRPCDANLALLLRGQSVSPMCPQPI